MTPRRALAALALVAATPATAHIQLVYPPARSGTAAAPDFVNQKAAPCGVAGRSANVTTLQAGGTITVLFDEIIDHPGFYRIAFDTAGDDDLAPPVLGTGGWSNPPGVRVLADRVPDAASGLTRGAVTVQLPDVPCTTCTLQLVQVMTDSSSFYFMCADVVLAAASSAPVCGNGVVEPGEACDDGNTADGDGCSASCTVEAAPPPPGGGPPPQPPSGGGGGGCGSPGGGALAIGLALLPLAVRRRRA